MIFSINELHVLANTWKDESKTIVFTNGCFDLLHQGHMDLLTQSKSLGDKLIAGLNSDSSVIRLKGKGCPIESEETQAKHRMDLGFINGICVFDEDTPIELINAI